MAYKTDTSSPFNPVAFWTDMGLRGLEMTLSSAQNITEGVDRLARAGASAAASEQVESPSAAVIEPVGTATSSGLQLVVQMQRTTFDLMTRVWQQWMSAFGTLATLGSGRSSREGLAAQNPWLSVMPDGLLPGGEADTSRTKRQSGGRRKESGGLGMDHAFARDEPKRRSRASHATKPRSRSR